MLFRIGLILCCLPSLAGAGPEQVGTTSAAFVKLGSGSRPEALGGAYTALADDASGIDFNPAGMSQMLGGEIQVTHTQWFQGLRYENINGVFSLGNGGMVGMTFDFLSMGSITRTEQLNDYTDPEQIKDNFRETGSFTPFDMQFAVAYSRPLYSSLLVGVNFKVLSQNMDDRSALGLGLDIGSLLRTPVEGLTVGLVFQNLGTPIKLNREAFNLPWNVRLGTAYRMFEKKLIFLLESDLPSDNAEVFSFGAEYSVADKFYPRVGYRLNGIFNPWSVGLGLKFGQATFDLSVVPYGELGLTYRASLGYRFGEPAAALLAPLPYLSRAKPVILLPKATAPDKVVAWGLFIYDSSKPAKMVKQFSGKGAPENEIRWDGQFASGQAAPEGSYHAIFSARYATGKVVNTPYVRVEVNNTAPQVDLSLDPLCVNLSAAGEAFVPTSFKVALKSGRMAVSWRLEVLDNRSQVFRTYQGDGPPPAMIVWDGKSDKGKALISGQIYQARMWAIDPLGNEAVSLSPVSFRAVFR